jgi:hypothetical protein
MNENMDKKEPRTGSPTGGTRGADYVFRVYRQGNAPFTKMMWTAAILQLVFFGVFPVFLLRSPIGLFLLILPLPVLIALPFVLGILVRREFVNDVIQACRRVCSEKEIVSGAMKSLRFMYFRYLLCLLPGILLFLFLNRFPRYFVSAIWVYLPEIAVFLLGEYALAWYPVARAFSRRSGMIVMMPVIFLAQIVLEIDFLYAASGLIHMDSSPDFNGLVVKSIVILVVCAAIYGGGLRYFTRAALADAEQNGLLN